MKKLPIFWLVVAFLGKVSVHLVAINPAWSQIVADLADLAKWIGIGLHVGDPPPSMAAAAGSLALPTFALWWTSFKAWIVKAFTEEQPKPPAGPAGPGKGQGFI